MGEYFKLACLKCKVMIHLGKLSEPDREKNEAIWWFINHHLGSRGCDLRIIGDECNSDNEVIKHDENYSWYSDFKQIEKGVDENGQ